MTSLPPPTSPPAGWYPDPYGQGTRYFDGVAWAPLVPPPPPMWAVTPAPPTLAPAREPHATLPIAAAVGALVILFASLVTGRGVIALLDDRDWPILAYVAILTVVGYGPSVAWCWFVSRRWGTGRLSYDIGLRWRWSDVGWGPLIWLSAVIGELVVAAFVLALEVPTSNNTDGVSDVDAGRGYVIALLVTAVVAAPLVEEMVFRGVVLRGFLQRMGPALTIVLQGMLFGAAHFDPVRGTGNIGLAAILSAVGVVFGIGAYLLRRIGPTVVAHAVFNAVVLTIVLSGVLDDAAR